MRFVTASRRFMIPLAVSIATAAAAGAVSAEKTVAARLLWRFEAGG